MASIFHFALCKITGPGTATIVYAHPEVYKLSKVLNNSAMFTQPTGSLVRVSLKRMPSTNRRMLTGASLISEVNTVQGFLELPSILSAFKTSAANEERLSSGAKAAVLFDGIDDDDYYINRSVPRFEGVPTGKPAIKVTAPVTKVGFSEAAFGVANVSVSEAWDPNKIVEYGKLFVSAFTAKTLVATSNIAKKIGAANLLLIGASGNGKTSLALALAEQNKMSFVKVNCSVVRDTEEWFGYREAVSGSTKFIATDFTKAVEAGNAVILLDELNRLEPYLHNSLMPLLDETRETHVHGKDIKCGPNVIFVSTMNVGNGFVGTFILDNAMKNRMDATIAVQQLTADEEIKLMVERTKCSEAAAKEIEQSLTKIRGVISKNKLDLDASTRTALKLAKLVSVGELTIREAFQVVVINNGESIEEQKLLNDALI